MEELDFFQIWTIIIPLKKKKKKKKNKIFGERKITSTIKLVHTKLHNFFLTIANLVYLMVNNINLRWYPYFSSVNKYLTPL